MKVTLDSYIMPPKKKNIYISEAKSQMGLDLNFHCSCWAELSCKKESINSRVGLDSDKYNPARPRREEDVRLLERKRGKKSSRN